MAETVSDFLIDRLREWGIHRIFGYPGDGINGIMGALDRANGDAAFIQVRHEEMAAFMACAPRQVHRATSASASPRQRPGRHPSPQRPL